MLANVYSATVVGVSPMEVTVEVDVAPKGFPGFTVVGLPSKAVEEAKERVKTAIQAIGIDFPQQRITVNLAPGDVPKEGTCYDVPIAVGILIATHVIDSLHEKCYWYGELGLDGSVRHTRGALLLSLLAQEQGVRQIFVPRDNAREASAVGEVMVHALSSLRDCITHFNNSPLPSYSHTPTKEDTEESCAIDFADIFGQESAKRALEIAAAGGHNVFMIGPPGSGKTMLARALPGILPPLEKSEALEVTKLYSIAGALQKGKGLMFSRPFRSPHHTTSRIGLIGGGTIPRPGEISLAHRGVLFLDELPEFPRSTIEALRQPLEDGEVNIVRVSGTVNYPTQCMVVASANPCPCGYLTHPKKSCTCLPTMVIKYQKRVSGPMLDRFDIHLSIPPVDVRALKQEGVVPGEKSNIIQKRVISARALQEKRFSHSDIHANADMNISHVRKYCKLPVEAEELLQRAATTFNLSARTYFRIIKVARTIADLMGSSDITQNHIAEAIQYRVKQ